MKLTKSPLLAPAALILALTMTGCGADVDTTGPVEVTSPKAGAPVEPTAPVTTLTRFDPDEVPGATAIDWGTTLTTLWLPQAVDVVPGIDGATATEGSAYLQVPAPFDRTAARVAAEQDRARFAEFLEVDVPSEGTTTDPQADKDEEASSGQGKVITATTDDTRYTVTIAPDEDETDFTVVMVSWEPAPTS